MPDEADQLYQRIKSLEAEVAALKSAPRLRGVRKRSTTSIAGLPLYDIALGPDPEKGELRGHARGIVAIGDTALGVVAIGGLAIGFISLGGAAIGILIGIGGVGIGALALGGFALGLVAFGGGAVGLVAVGGGAFGYYACGGGAHGKYIFTAMQQDPEAVRFFRQWLPGFSLFFQPPGG